MSSDTVRINGVMMTRSRAVALGLIDSAGNATKAAEAVQPKVKRGPVSNAARKVAREADVVSTDALGNPDVPMTKDGRLKVKRIKPLLPKNVDATGAPIEDEETLAKIAAETQAKEAAAKAKREAEGGA